MADNLGVRIDGVRELVRAIGQVDATYRKDIGKANKAIGQRIIDDAFPKPDSVGTGAGAKPRASAVTTSLRIMAGGAHRHHHVQQWGKRYRPREAKRPYIRKAAENDMPRIEHDYLNTIAIACQRAGLAFRKG
jgi:hypothetical protein